MYIGAKYKKYAFSCALYLLSVDSLYNFQFTNTTVIWLYFLPFCHYFHRYFISRNLWIHPFRGVRLYEINGGLYFCVFFYLGYIIIFESEWNWDMTDVLCCRFAREKRLRLWKDYVPSAPLVPIQNKEFTAKVGEAMKTLNNKVHVPFWTSEH